MKKLLLLLILLPIVFLSGCSKEISNDDIIKETKKCESAGLRAKTIPNGWTYDVVKIQCVPKGDNILLD